MKLLAKVGLAALVWLGDATAFSCELQVSAATSLRGAIKDVAEAFEGTRPDCHVYLNIAGSHALGRQVAAGAKVDVFLPANSGVLNRTEANILQQKILLQNELVAIGNKPADNIEDLLSQANHIAIGQKALPAGDYAHGYLRARGWLNKLRPKFIYTDNVRGVLTLVERGGADAGFIYRTELQLGNTSPRVVFNVPDVTVTYPVALLSSKSEAAALYAFLSSRKAMKIFQTYGLRFIDPHG